MYVSTYHTKCLCPQVAFVFVALIPTAQQGKAGSKLAISCVTTQLEQVLRENIADTLTRYVCSRDHVNLHATLYSTRLVCYN